MTEEIPGQLVIELPDQPPARSPKPLVTGRRKPTWSRYTGQRTPCDACTRLQMTDPRAPYANPTRWVRRTESSEYLCVDHAGEARRQDRLPPLVERRRLML